MKNVKVSIIVPVYNEEKHIKKCIDSIINQTYKNIEILLINDGSKDKSLKILREYEKKYPKLIKVFTHKNRGLGFTRNVGLENATGDFITLLDSDDWMAEDYIEVLKNAIGKNDIVISGFKRYNSEYQFQYEKKPLDSEWSKYKYCSIAGKMYRNSFLQKNQLRYSKVKMGEDSYFNISAYAKTNKIIVADYAGYCNYENLSSMTQKVEYTEDKSFFTILKLIIDTIDTTKLNHNQFSFYVLKTLIVDIFLYKDCLTEEELIKNYRIHIKWYKEYLDSINKKFKLYWQKDEEFKINFLVNMFVILSKLHLDSLLIIIIKRMRVSMI